MNTQLKLMTQEEILDVINHTGTVMGKALAEIDGLLAVALSKTQDPCAIDFLHELISPLTAFRIGLDVLGSHNEALNTIIAREIDEEASNR